MGSSANICLESAFIIGTPRCSAIRRQSSVLPTPVGPSITIRVLLMSCWMMNGVVEKIIEAIDTTLVECKHPVISIASLLFYNYI